MVMRRKNSIRKLITGEELLDAMALTDNFSHLKIFLGYSHEVGILPQRYLMVSPSDFGIVKLLDLDYEKEEVVLHLQDDKTKVSSKLYLDIHDNRYKFLLIRWRDITDLVMEDGTNGDNELLELE